MEGVELLMAQYSIAHQEYIQKQRKARRTITYYRVLIFIAFLIIWELTARIGIIDSFIFSSPSNVVMTFISMLADKSLFYHIYITLFETLTCFLLVIIFSIIISTLLWLSDRAAQITEPFLVILNSLPKSALVSLLIVWLGLNYKTIIIAGISVAVFGSILNIYTGFKNTDEEKLKLITTLGGSKYTALIKVVYPESISIILNTMKVNIGLSLVGVIIGEFLCGRSGLGYLIIYGSQVFKLDWLIMSIILLCIIAMVLYKLLQMLEKKFS